MMKAREGSVAPGEQSVVLMNLDFSQRVVGTYLETSRRAWLGQVFMLRGSCWCTGPRRMGYREVNHLARRLVWN